MLFTRLTLLLLLFMVAVKKLTILTTTMHVGSGIKSGTALGFQTLLIYFLVLKISKLQYLCCISGELNVD
jgi:hypothetical protein